MYKRHFPVEKMATIQHQGRNEHSTSEMLLSNNKVCIYREKQTVYIKISTLDNCLVIIVFRNT
jgi:hypothetical protein